MHGALRQSSLHVLVKLCKYVVSSPSTTQFVSLVCQCQVAMLESDRFIKIQVFGCDNLLFAWFPTFWMSVGPWFLRVKLTNNSTLNFLRKLLGLENVSTTFL
jgi:hypothetical protein